MAGMAGPFQVQKAIGPMRVVKAGRGLIEGADTTELAEYDVGFDEIGDVPDGLPGQNPLRATAARGPYIVTEEK